MRSRLLAALTLVGAAMLGGASATPALAAGTVTGIVTGSWWSIQPDSGILPTPATVTPGGIWVGSNATGPTAISALRFTLAGAEAPILHLQVATAQPAAQVSITACAAKGAWKATTAGPWSARPAADCSSSSSGVFSADSKTFTIDLSGLPISTSGVVDVVLQPTPLALPLPVSLPLPGNVPTPASTFDATFSKVTASQISAVATTTAPDAPAAPDQGTVSTPSLTPAFSPPPLPTDSGGSGSAVLEPPIAIPGPTTTAPVPGGQLSLGRATFPTQATAAKSKKGLTTRTRWLLAIIILDIGLIAGWQGWLTPGSRTKRLTLYDDPGHLPDAPAARVGRAPTLR